MEFSFALIFIIGFKKDCLVTDKSAPVSLYINLRLLNTCRRKLIAFWGMCVIFTSCFLNSGRFLGRPPRKGNGNPLQYSCLENSMGRGAWQALAMGEQRDMTERLGIQQPNIGVLMMFPDSVLKGFLFYI